MSVINNVQFSVDVKSLEKSEVESALEKARDYKKQSLPQWKISRISRQLSVKAYDNFKQKITEQFAAECSPDLLFLTFQARMNQFLILLRSDIEAVILKPETDDLAEKTSNVVNNSLKSSKDNDREYYIAKIMSQKGVSKEVATSEYDFFS